MAGSSARTRSCPGSHKKHLESVPATGHHHIDGDTVLSVVSGEAGAKVREAVCAAVDDVTTAFGRANAFARFAGITPNARPPWDFVSFATPPSARCMPPFGGTDRRGGFRRPSRKRNGGYYPATPECFTRPAISRPHSPEPVGTAMSASIAIYVTSRCARARTRVFPGGLHESYLSGPSATPARVDYRFGRFSTPIPESPAHCRLRTGDYVWVTERLVEMADEFCNGRIVSVLEGGYDLDALAASAAAHVRVLLNH